jgi:hypothetical protein
MMNLCVVILATVLVVVHAEIPPSCDSMGYNSKRDCLSMPGCMYCIENGRCVQHDACHGLDKQTHHCDAGWALPTHPINCHKQRADNKFDVIMVSIVVCVPCGLIVIWLLYHTVTFAWTKMRILYENHGYNEIV